MITDKMRAKWKHQKEVISSAIADGAIYMDNWDKDFFKNIQGVVNLTLKQEQALRRIYRRVG